METPPIVRYPSLLILADMKIDETVEGILHVGTKMILGGGSKSKKTWALLDMALSVVHGIPWLGRKTTPIKTLYINLEILPVFFAQRLKAITEARKLADKKPLAVLDVWNLRGYCKPHVEMTNLILNKIKDDGYGLIIIDPIYKMLGTADENKANEVTAMLNSLEHISTETGAAVVFAAHFSKGDQSLKDHIDRVSGSGAFARDPDTIASITQHEEEDCFSIEFTLRNLKEVEAFVVEWTYPVLNRRDELNPKKLKRAKGGRDAIFDSSEVMEVLPDSGLTCKDWLIEAKEAVGISESTFHKIRRSLEASGAVYKEGKRWYANKMIAAA